MTPIDLLKSSAASNTDSRSSSATITPVNKAFPRSPFGDGDESTKTAYNRQPLRSTATPTNRSADTTGSSTLTATPKSSTKKQSSFSFISQLSDDFFGDVASKAKSTIPTLAAANRKLTNMLRESENSSANNESSESNSTGTISNSPSQMLSRSKDSNNNLAGGSAAATVAKKATPPPPLGIVDSNLSSGQSRHLPQTVYHGPAGEAGSSQHHHHHHHHHHNQQQGSGSATVAGQAGGSSSDLNSENEVFLKECLTSVLEGQGVGWLKYNRVKRLMEDENYRNFVLSRLNTSLDKKLANDEEHIECIRVSKPVFKVNIFWVLN